MKKIDTGGTNLADASELPKESVHLNFSTEENMAIKRCVKSGSKIYCYDKEDGVVYVYPEQTQSLRDCPEHVLADLIAGNENAYIVTSFKKAPQIELLSQDEINSLVNALNTADE